MMQFGINLWVWGAPITDDRIAERVPQAARMGFDVVEFPLEEPGGFDYEQTRDRLDRHDLDSSVVLAMSEERDLLHDDDVVRENGREYIRQSVDAAAAIGSDRVVGPAYSAVGRTWRMSDDEREQAVEDVATQLADLADYAGERGVTICVEPLNRFETSFLNTAEQTIEVVDRVDHPHCQILLDTFHMNIEETSLADAIRATGDRLAHFHACGNNRGAPGNDTIDWPSVVEALDDVGYDDQAVIESFTPEVESIARAAAIWRPLAESQDTLAEDGLAALKRYFA
ncbi:sugar phosphate isomerase/epimerase family protein [Halomicroarcula sp. GCM10025324]|uniref:sugar phosphate isomerase/epimerase family protein n=1 Tax=Haloarcula TaxID=2237 RepID=UPI0023E7F411|nr:sugar phosphate isomerase/epimerase family protein [Halomicroarcula sp. ZS-22-S1]